MGAKCIILQTLSHTRETEISFIHIQINYTQNPTQGVYVMDIIHTYIVALFIYLFMYV